MPEVKGKHFAYTEKGKEAAKAYASKVEGGVGKYKSPAEYSPFKMGGHELPGPNQRTPNKALEVDPLNDEMVDKTSKKSGTLYTEGGVGSSPSKAFGGAWKALKTAFGKKGKTPGPAEAAAEQAAGAAGAVPPHSHNPDGSMGAPPAGGSAEVAAEEVAKEAALEEGVGGKVFNPMSDIRVKEKIERTGTSPSGIPMYEFNYIGGTNRYSGTMAQDLLEMNIDAVSLGDDGYYRVNYNNIDVDMRQIN